MSQKFNCPNCGASNAYSGEGNTVRCAYCGSDVRPPDEMVNQAAVARVELFETVMAQDMKNLAPIQASISSPRPRPFQLGWHERLIHHFQRAVDLAIGVERLPAGSAVSDTLDHLVEST